MAEVARKPIGVIDSKGGYSLGTYQLTQRLQSWTLKRCARGVIAEDIGFRNLVPFPLQQ